MSIPLSRADHATKIGVAQLTAPPPISAPPAAALPEISSRSDQWIVASATIALWLAIQLAFMAIALLHIPLAADYAVSERLLPEVLLAGQIGSAALLAPALCRNFATALLAAATVWPLLILAGALAMRGPTTSVLAATAVSIWLLTLTLWCVALPSITSRSAVSAVAVLLAWGPPLLAYLQKEFETVTPAKEFIFLTPLFACWSLANGGTLSLATLACYTATGISPAILLLLRPRQK